LVCRAFGLIIGWFVYRHAAAVVLCVALAIIYFVVLSLIQFAAAKYFQAAVYLYARNQQRLPVLNRTCWRARCAPNNFPHSTDR